MEDKAPPPAAPARVIAQPSSPVPSPPATPWFREVTDRSGVGFVHPVEPAGRYALTEVMGSGLAAFDTDGDGRLDLYFAATAGSRGKPAVSRLFRQTPAGRFVDATAECGCGDAGSAMGAAAGDVDNDGDLDLLVTSDGPDVLFVNDGHARFKRRLLESEPDVRWGTSAAFLDFDGDGFLDVWIANYVFPDDTLRCDVGGRADYCPPRSYRPSPDRLLRNRGDGTFTDVSRAAGIDSVARHGLGVVIEDFDRDGWPDVYVANDGDPNSLWMNQRDGTFRDDGILLGVALDSQGRAEAGMGIAVGDVDDDGSSDLLVTNLRGETNALYRSDGRFFVDAAGPLGLDDSSRPFTGFGAALFDADLDGDLDLAVANGDVERGRIWPGVAVAPYWQPYAQPNTLLQFDRGRFSELAGTGDPFLAPVEVSRGLLAADLDADGDLDLVVSNCAGPARLFENVAARAGHWLSVRAVDPALHRDAYGARIVVGARGRSRSAVLSSATSYLSSLAQGAHFGLGAAARLDSLEVVWPGGTRERFAQHEVDREVVLVRGTGTPP